MKRILGRLSAWAVLIAVLAAIVLGLIWLYDHVPTLFEAIGAMIIAGCLMAVVTGVPLWIWAFISTELNNRQYRREERIREIVRHEMNKR